MDSRLRGNDRAFHMSASLNIITDHLDLWTTAKLPKKKGGRGRGAKSNKSPHGIQKLRELILELAVRGKLVPQDPSDEPASELLKRIASEKAKLIKEGKIKKQKPLSPIGEDEVPFSLPKGWGWACLDSIGNINGGFAFKSSRYAEKGVRVIRISDFDEQGFKDDKIVRYEYSDLLEPFKLCENNILMAMTGGTVGKCLLVQKLSEPMVVNQRVATIKLTSKVNPHFVSSTLQTSTVQQVIYEAKNSTNDNISMTDIRGFLIAISPVQEQKRIVAKVDELMALCDKLEQKQAKSGDAHQQLVETLLGTLTQAEDNAELEVAWQRIAEHFDTLFTTEASIDQLKQTILQLAVMGKLVPQDPTDEPASELLKKIAAEKAKLIKAGKIKKQKPQLAISESEKPFDLPQSWEWCRLGYAGIGATGKTPSTKNELFFGGDIPFVGPGQITPEGELLVPDKTLTDAGMEQSVEALPNDILMVCIGGSIGKSVINDKPIAFNQQINAIRPIFVAPSFLNAALSTEVFYKSVIDNATGSATPIINRSKWESLLVPIAPLAEQHRIVAKVDELMTICDRLKEHLQEAQTNQIHLADAIVKRAAG